MAYQRIKKILGISATAVILAGLGVYKFHPHTYKVVDSTDPTCILGGHTTYECWCGVEYTENIEPTDHDYEETDTEPTCIEDGCKTFKCKICGNSYTEKIDKLGHDYVNGVCARCKGVDRDTIVSQQTEDGTEAKKEETKPTEAKPGKEKPQSSKPSSGGNGGNGGGSTTPAPQPQPTKPADTIDRSTEVGEQPITEGYAPDGWEVGPAITEEELFEGIDGLENIHVE